MWNYCFHSRQLCALLNRELTKKINEITYKTDKNTNILVILLDLFVNWLLKQQSTQFPAMKAVISHEKFWLCEFTGINRWKYIEPKNLKFSKTILKIVHLKRNTEQSIKLQLIWNTYLFRLCKNRVDLLLDYIMLNNTKDTLISTD
jgi:hypothetical protein